MREDDDDTGLGKILVLTCFFRFLSLLNLLILFLFYFSMRSLNGEEHRRLKKKSVARVSAPSPQTLRRTFSSLIPNSKGDLYLASQLTESHLNI